MPTTNNSVEDIQVPSNFEKIEFPKKHSDEWYQLNWSNFDYRVKNIDNKLAISINNEFNNFEYHVEGGKLIGTNYSGNDETFYFQPTDNELERIDIKKGNVLFVFELNGQLYFIESVESDTLNKGYLYELNWNRNKFNYRLVLEIDDTPIAFLLHNEILFVATNCHFISIDNLKQTIIFENTIWDMLYPNSIVYFNDRNIFVGLRGGIVRIDLPSHSIEYYKTEDIYY